MHPLVNILGMTLSDFGIWLALLPLIERAYHGPALTSIVASINLDEIKPRIAKRSVPQGFL